MRYALIILTILFLMPCLIASDPVVTTVAQDSTVACGSSGIEIAFTQWYESAGGAVAMDPDGGPIIFVGEPSIEEALVLFEGSTAQLCGATMEVSVAFIAVDQEGDDISVGSAVFASVDIVQPIILQIPSFATYDCQEGLQDTLITWIKNKGGALATDACSAITWTNFVWNDTEGNSGIGSIDNGPYPQLLGSCAYTYNMSFIAVDECNNQRATTGSFSITDDSGPVFAGIPASGTYACDNVPQATSVAVSDFCDPDVTFILTEESTQGIDAQQCSFYDYTISRTWTAEDACGNTTEEAVTLEIRDQEAPVVSGTDTITVDCASFVETDSVYIVAIDDCSQVSIAVQDSPFTQACSFAVDRTYTVTDVCSNSITFAQHIIVEDQSAPIMLDPPTDEMLSCEQVTEVEALFTAWVSDILDRSIVDGCTSATVFAAQPNSYDITDDSTYPGTPVGQLDDAVCPSAQGLVRSETVDFVVYDECGRASVYTATFGLQDMEAPTIADCVEDITVSLTGGECEATITIPPVSVGDNCTANEITAVVTLSQSLHHEIDIFTSTEIQNVPQGVHTATLTVTDCAGNSSTCTFSLSVLDMLPPAIDICGSDEVLTLGADQCTATYQIPFDILATDNCSFEKRYTQRLPETVANEQLTFSVDGADTTVSNKIFIFEEAFTIEYTAKPVELSVSLTANTLSTEAFFTLFGENGYEIGTTPVGADCQLQVQTYEIPANIFNEWVSDGAVTISAIASGVGIVPCGMLDANGQDGVSSLAVTIQYSDAEPLYQVTGATSGPQTLLDDGANIELNVGLNTITYAVTDASGNEGTCSFIVEVVDEVAPMAICKNAVISIPPDGEQTITLDPLLVDGGSNDFCGEVFLEVSPAVFSCDQVGSEVEVVLTVTDVSANTSSCTATVKVEPFDLMPSFSAGLCENDTLLLLANAPEPTTIGAYTYAWEGPDMFSSDDEAPFIIDPTEINNGTYTVTVTGFDGCSTTGSVQVSIEALSTPALTASSDTVCLGDELVLTSTTYTGNITYDWYEGTFPTGTLLESTSSASLVVSPAAGSHFYYVIARSPICESNASAVKLIEVIETPVAMVNDNFLNICEGETFALGTTSFGAGYTYQWTGPDGFSSDKPLPEEITAFSQTQAGNYSLIISVGNCSSDTAVTRVNVFDKPNTPIITSGTTFCEGSTVSLTVNNVPSASLYTWYLDGAVYTTDMDNSLVINNAQAEISGSWQVTVRDGLCTSDTSAIQNIFIDDLQEVSVTNTGPACAGDSIQLFVTFIAGATYQWAGPGGFSSDLQNPKILAQPGEYTVEVLTGTNCQTTASTTVSVSTAPTITALSNNGQPCMEIGTNLVFFPTVVPTNPAFVYSWTGPNGYTSADRNPTIVDPDQSVNGTYTLIVSNGSCSSEPVSTVVDITIVPQQPSILIPTVCAGADALLTSTVVVQGAEYIWTTPSGETTTSDPSLVITVASSADAGVYTLVVRAGICESLPSPEAVLTVETAPSAPNFTTNSPLCSRDELVLSISNPDPLVDYLWQGPSGPVGQGDTLRIAEVTTAEAGAYTVQVDIEGCTSAFSIPQEVTVAEPLMTPATELLAYELCRGITSTLEICIDAMTAEPGATYVLFNINTGENIATSTSICFLLEDLTVFELGTNFLYIVAEENGCTSDQSAQFRVELSDVPTVVATILEADQIICEEAPITLSAANGPPLVDLSWKSGDMEIMFDELTAQQVVVSNLAEGTNEIVLSYTQNACIDYSTDTIVLTVQADPLLDDDLYTTIFGEPIIIDIFDNDQLPAEFDVEITEQPIAGSIEIVGEVVTYNPDARLSGTITFVYEVCAVECEDQCDEATVTIEVGDDASCFAPTIITPNEDGINDAFVVPCLSGGSFPNSELTIFNQWGDEIYGAKNYDNSWKGTYEGKVVAAGTYFYILDLGDGREPIHSFLTIQI